MITQTLAIFHDAYRELNSRKMFWIVMILSGLAICSFAIVGVGKKSLTLLWFELPALASDPAHLYKWLFSNIVVGGWLTWIATILALISTAGIFPDFVSGGSIDLFLSKPISRLRLFLTKYLTGLLFVFLQVTLFCAASLLVLLVRGRIWQPGLFLAVPIVVVFYSYLYSVCTLLGILTRSTLAALLLTLLFWIFIVGISFTETQLLDWRLTLKYQSANYSAQIQNFDRRIEIMSRPPATSTPATGPTTHPAQRMIDDFIRTRDHLVTQRDDAARAEGKVAYIHHIAYWVKTIVPKTKATTDLLDRRLFSDAELAESADRAKRDAEATGEGEFGELMRNATSAEIERKQINRHRSVAWIVGTSVLFEAVVLTLAAWIFHRRDF